MFIVYRTANRVTQEFYIGVHRTDNLDDAYLGSGRLLRASIALHGPQHFERTLLATGLDRETAYRLERELVEPLLGTPGCLNLHPGGRGGFHYINRRGLHSTAAATAALKCLQETDPAAFAEGQKRATAARVHSPVFQAARRAMTGKHFEGKTHTEETKQRMRASHQGKTTGTQNGAHGTVWITHTEHGNRRIPRGDLSVWEALGWTTGRVITPP